MAFKALSQALSTNISQSVAVSQLKHNEKIAELKDSIETQALTRRNRYEQKLTTAMQQHHAWHQSLDEVGKEIYSRAKAALEAANPTAPTKD